MGSHHTVEEAPSRVGYEELSTWYLLSLDSGRPQTLL